MSDAWECGYNAGLRGETVDETKPAAWHFGFHAGIKERNRRAFQLIINHLSQES